MTFLIQHFLVRSALVVLPSVLLLSLVPVEAQEPSPDDSQHHCVGQFDWPQLGGTPQRNNTAKGKNIPIEWDVKTGKNIKWKAKLGSQTYGNTVVANGHVYVGTNNGAEYLKRYPKNIDLGVLLCFRETDGKFLWQHSCEKLPTGRVHDWPLQGICSAPIVEGDRLWLVTNRGEVVCLDTEGFLDHENDGPFRDESNENQDESDVVWAFDMMKELGVSQHNMATCGPTIWGDTLFICTSNGVDETHLNIPAPEAPSFMAMNKHTGEVLWTDNSPGTNILHGQWSCPAVGVFDGVPQVLFAGGDGWLYSFHAERWNDDGTPILLWKFDGNPKESEWVLGGSGTRNNMVAVPVIYDGLVYVAMGQDPEHGEGIGHLWCIDPTKRGDVSSELVIDGTGKIAPHRRQIAIIKWEKGFSVATGTDHVDSLNEGTVSGTLRTGFRRRGVNLPTRIEVETLEENSDWRITYKDNGKLVEFKLSQRTNRYRSPTPVLTAYRRTAEKVIPNPNSALVWHFSQEDVNGDGEIDYLYEEFHRTICSPAIKDNLLIIPGHLGIVYCLNAKTGKWHWAADLLAACWGSPLIVGEKVYVGDEDGDVSIFNLSPNPDDSLRWDEEFNIFEAKQELLMPSSVHTTPVVANDTLFISTKNTLYAIAAEESP